MNIKTILGVGALAATGMAVFGKNKVSAYKNVLDRLQITITKIKEVSFNQEINFKVDIVIKNPTATAINVPGNLLTIKTLYFYSQNGKLLGKAYPNISKIALPANSAQPISNIPVSLSLADIGNNLAEILDIATNKDLLKIVAEIEAFGQSFTVNA